MIKITIKYNDSIKPRIITISDSNVNDEVELVDWILTNMWYDCYMDNKIKSPFYYNNQDVCLDWFELCYKVYSIFNWFEQVPGWQNTENSYCNIEVV